MGETQNIIPVPAAAVEVGEDDPVGNIARGAGDASEVGLTPYAATPIGGRLLASVSRIVEKIMVLRVTTVIGTIADGQITDTPAKGLTVSFTAKPAEIACTTLDMALGNCTTVRSPQFADNAAYAKLHDDSLTLAREVRSETIDLLIKAVEAVKAMAKL